MLCTDTLKNRAMLIQVSFAFTRYVTGVGLGSGVFVRVGKGVIVAVCVPVAVAVMVAEDVGRIIASGVWRRAKYTMIAPIPRNKASIPMAAGRPNVIEGIRLP
jgi:hypothetical protein